VQVFERHDAVGGLWNFDNPGTPLYESAHFISSKTLSAFPGYPWPAGTPDYPSWEQVRDYLHDFARAYELNDVITTGCGVESATWLGDHWQVETDRGELHRFDNLVCANGALWHPNMPEFDGEFGGDIIHSVDYRSIDDLRNRRVLVVGAGNSGVDIAGDAAIAASKAVLSMRRGYHFVPKHIFGTPADVFADQGPTLPARLEQLFFTALLRLTVGKPERYGLPTPDHKILQTHPILNSAIFGHLSHGDLTVATGVERLEGNIVHFSDGTSGEFDLIICATGYDVAVPYLDSESLEWKQGRPQMLMHLFDRSNPHLFSLGFCEGDGGGYPIFDEMADAIANTVRLVGRADGDPPTRWTRHLRSASPQTRPHTKLLNSSRHVNYVHLHAYRKALEHMRTDFGWRPYQADEPVLDGTGSPVGVAGG